MFEVVLAIVNRAVTDDEKFAAMLIIAKSISPTTMPEEKFHTLLESVGLQFPCRLLATACKQTEDQETREAYGAISASVLKLFCIYHRTHGGIDVKPVIPLLLRGIETFSSQPNCKDMVDDCLEALISLLEKKSDIDYVAIFNVVVSSPYPLQEKLLSTLRLVLQICPEVTETESFKDWKNSISTEFRTDKEGRKFEICKILCVVFQNLHEKWPPQSKEWLDDVMIGLGDILCSKVTQEQRHDAIGLTSELLSLYGLPSFIDKSSEKNFIVVVTRLSCIEIGLFFQDVINQSGFCGNQEDLSLVLSCFKITEIFCEAVAQFEQNETGAVADHLSFEQIRLAQPALCEMVGSVKEHISLSLTRHVELERKEEQLFHSCLRVFGSWMNIEYNLSSSQGAQALSIVPAVLKYVWSVRDFHLIKFILPAVMLSTDCSSLSISTAQEIFFVLCEILADLVKMRNSHDSWSAEQTITNLIIQCIIAICQSRFEAIDNNTEVVSNVVNGIKEGICEYDGNLVVEAYIYTLVIIWLNLVPTIRCGSDQLFLKCLDFLFGAFKVSATSNLALAPKYQHCWVEVSPLWEVTLREVVKYCNECVEGNKLYQSSQWPNVLLDVSNTTEISSDFGDIACLLELT